MLQVLIGQSPCSESRERGSEMVLTADVIAVDRGGIVLLYADTAIGRDWLADHVAPGCARYGGGYAVDHRFVADIITRALEDGLTVQDGATGRYAHAPEVGA